MTPDPRAFAEGWVADWNSLDLDRVMAHYGEDVVFTSPYVIRIAGDPTGRLIGKTALRDYWARALAQSGLIFTLKGVYTGPDGLTIRYHSSRTGAEVVEVVRFDDAGLVCESAAYYE